MKKFNFIILGSILAICFFNYGCASVPSTANKTKNLIKNGSFEYGLGNSNGQFWEFIQNPGKHRGSMSIDQNDPFQGQKCLKMDVIEVGDVLWEPHVALKGLSVVKDKKYTFSYMVRADKPYKSTLCIRRLSTETQYDQNIDFNVGVEWQKVTKTFTAPETNKGDVQVITWLGRDTVNLWIDDVIMVEEN
jgi:hypothetical protein